MRQDPVSKSIACLLDLRPSPFRQGKGHKLFCVVREFAYREIVVEFQQALMDSVSVSVYIGCNHKGNRRVHDWRGEETVCVQVKDRSTDCRGRGQGGPLITH